jgi:hypothetical protein
VFFIIDRTGMSFEAGSKIGPKAFAEDMAGSIIPDKLAFTPP